MSADPLSKKKVGVEESLFEGMNVAEALPDGPSPTEAGRKRAQAERRKEAQETLRTNDARAASAHDILTEWVGHLRAQGIVATSLPDEIKVRVGRTLKSLIRKGYTYDEIVNGMRTWTVKDLRNRKAMPRTSMIEVYARQWRGETVSEASATQEEHERIRTEEIMRGQAPSVGTRRQRERDASLMAIFGASSSDQQAPTTLELEQ